MHLLTRIIFVLCALALTSCQGPSDSDSNPSSQTFLWSDLSRPVSFPGPLTNSDSTYETKSLRIIANIAHAEWDSIRELANDSLFVAVAETPYGAQLEGLDQLQLWRTSLGSIHYEAFNVRGVYNEGSNSHVAYVFGRWKSQNALDSLDKFMVFAVAWNNVGAVTGIARFETPWPIDNDRMIKPTRNPENFHFFSETRLGSDSAARKAMDFTTAIFRNNLRMHQHLMADSVEYHDGRGKYGYYNRADVLDLLDHTSKSHKHHLIRYTAVIPWEMIRFGREAAVVVTYEDWVNRDGSAAVYAFCRLYFFDEQGKINNVVFTRRLVHPVGRYPLVD